MPYHLKTWGICSVDPLRPLKSDPNRLIYGVIFRYCPSSLISIRQLEKKKTAPLPISYPNTDSILLYPPQSTVLKFLSFAALSALGGQALAIAVDTPYIILDGDNFLDGSSDIRFEKSTSDDNTGIWYFQPTGNDDTFSIVNTATGYPMICDKSGANCTPSESESQGFRFIEQGQDLYKITNESGDLFIAERPNGFIHLVVQAQDDETTVFKLVKGN